MSEIKVIHPLKIALRDYWSSFLLWMTVGAWAAIILFNISSSIRGTPPNRDFSEWLFRLSLALSVVSVIFATYRVAWVHRTIKSGVDVTGSLVAVPPFSGRQTYRITCEFPFEGKKTMVSIAIERKRVLQLGLKNGDAINLVVDRSNPKRVIIRELFCQ